MTRWCGVDEDMRLKGVTDLYRAITLVGSLRGMRDMYRHANEISSSATLLGSSTALPPAYRAKPLYSCRPVQRAITR